MKAIQSPGYGGPERLRLAEAPVPRPSASQVLVRVLASSVNPVDWKLHSGQYRWLTPVRFPSTPGFDLAGEVVETGVRVTRFRPARGRHGGPSARARGGGVRRGRGDGRRPHAGERTRGGRDAARGSRGAAGPAGPRAYPRTGQRVLIIGASGGVGHFAVQIARARGAHVTAVSGAHHAAMVRGLGADRVIDYAQEPDFLNTGPYDLIFDTIVREPVRALLAALHSSGAYVSTLPSFGRIAAALLLPAFSKRRAKIVSVRPRGEDLEELRRLCEAGALRPVIEKSFPLEELAAAHRLSRQGRTGGKIVIVVQAAGSDPG